MVDFHLFLGVCSKLAGNGNLGNGFDFTTEDTEGTERLIGCALSVFRQKNRRTHKESFVLLFLCPKKNSVIFCGEFSDKRTEEHIKNLLFFCLKKTLCYSVVGILKIAFLFLQWADPLFGEWFRAGSSVISSFGRFLFSLRSVLLPALLVCLLVCLPVRLYSARHFVS